MASGESSRGSTLSLEPMFRYKSANLRGDVEAARHSLERLLSDPRKRFMVIAQSLVFGGNSEKEKKKGSYCQRIILAGGQLPASN